MHFFRSESSRWYLNWNQQLKYAQVQWCGNNNEEKEYTQREHQRFDIQMLRMRSECVGAHFVLIGELINILFQQFIVLGISLWISTSSRAMHTTALSFSPTPSRLCKAIARSLSGFFSFRLPWEASLSTLSTSLWIEISPHLSVLFLCQTSWENYIHQDSSLIQCRIFQPLLFSPELWMQIYSPRKKIAQDKFISPLIPATICD